MLTRRLVRNLLGSVGQVAEKMAPAENVSTPWAKKAVASFKREAAVQQADFSKKFEGGEPHPELGAEAQLVTEFQISPQDDGKIRLRMVLQSKEYIETALPSQTFWGLSHLIEKQANTTQWDLAPRTPVVKQAVKGKPEEPPAKPRLN